jgi:putative phage-type endonuclease
MIDKVRRLVEKDYAAQRSDEWLRLRGNMLTASDAATAIGVNPYEKPKDLILKKCGYNEFKGNEATMHGNKYEDEARDIYCIRYNEVSHEIGLYQHPKYPWLGGSPDGITESGKLIEIKCPLRREITPEVPVYYMPQLQLLMEILDLDEAVFIQYKPAEHNWPKPTEFVVTNVPRDREWFVTNLPIMEDLWNKVVKYRANGGVEELLPKKREKKEKEVEKVKCEIQCDKDEDDYINE